MGFIKRQPRAKGQKMQIIRYGNYQPNKSSRYFIENTETGAVSMVFGEWQVPKKPPNPNPCERKTP
jgi:hypothetical protein